LNRQIVIRISKIFLPLLVLALVYWEGAKELKQIHLGQIIHELFKLHVGPIIQILLVSLFSVSVMSGYDFLIRRQFKLNVSLLTAFRFGWIANTFNNVIGFAGFTGAGVRALLYKNRDVATSTMTAAILFLSPMMIIGLSLLSWLGLSGAISISPLLKEHPWLVFAVWGMALYLPVFVIIQRSALFAKWFNRNEGKLAWSTIGASLGASLLEWFFAGLTFWFIVIHFFQPITLSEAMGIFTISAIAGLISMAPGDFSFVLLYPPFCDWLSLGGC
jgi:phosphatidylglycerol lysyltransferase